MILYPLHFQMQLMKSQNSFEKESSIEKEKERERRSISRSREEEKRSREEEKPPRPKEDRLSSKDDVNFMMQVRTTIAG